MTRQTWTTIAPGYAVQWHCKVVPRKHDTGTRWYPTVSDTVRSWIPMKLVSNSACLPQYLIPPNLISDTADR